MSLPQGTRRAIALLVALVLITPHAMVSAQAVEEISADLPAMFLRADEFPMANLDLEYGVITDIAFQADRLSFRTGEPVADSLEQLEELGWVGRAASSAAAIHPDDPAELAALGISQVTEYATEEGAVEGLQLPVLEAPNAEEIPLDDVPEIGDEARIVRATGTTPGGLESEGYIYLFRVEHLVASIVLFTFEGGGYDEPTVEDLAESAETFHERITDILDRDDPALFRLALRPEATDDLAWTTVFETTMAQDGEYLQRHNILDAHAERWQDLIDETGAIEFYQHESWLEEFDASGTDYTGYAYVLIHVIRHDSEEGAASYGEASIADFEENGLGDTEYTVLEDELEGLDGVTGIEYTYEVPGGESQGYQLYGSVGEYSVTWEIGSLEGADLDEVIPLFEAQLSCLESPEDPCGSIDVTAAFG